MVDIICRYYIPCTSADVHIIDVNDAEPRLLVINSKPRLSLTEKNEPKPNRDSSQTSPSRVETLTKYNRAEMIHFLSYILILIFIYFTYI